MVAFVGTKPFEQIAMGSKSNAINLNFSGYDATYSADISDYRTIGHAVLSTSTTTLP